MEAVDREVGMVPVEQRIVEADPQPLGPERVDHLPQQIATGRGVGRLVIGVLRIPEAETFMMLGGDHKILHSGLSGRARPLRRTKQIGIEEIEIDLIILVRDHFTAANPLVPARHRIESPVNEHPESIVNKPGRIAFSHDSDPFCLV